MYFPKIIKLINFQESRNNGFVKQVLFRRIFTVIPVVEFLHVFYTTFTFYLFIFQLNQF